jgi:hypothetical protein
MTAAEAAELDKDGMPWDERIHSSNHKKTARGVWMKRKKVSKELFAQVTAEIRARMAGGAPAAPGSVPAPPAGGVVSPAPPAAALPAAAVDPNTITTLPDFMRYCAACKIADEAVTAACVSRDVQAVALLGSSQYAGKIPEIVATLEAQRHA